MLLVALFPYLVSFRLVKGNGGIGGPHNLGFRVSGVLLGMILYDRALLAGLGPNPTP